MRAFAGCLPLHPFCRSGGVVRLAHPVFRVIRGRMRPWAMLGLLAVAAGAHAQPASDGAALGRDLRGVLEFLESRNPELKAMSLEADAARQRLGVSGALPDPMLSMELRDVPVDDPTLSPANAGSTRYALKQLFPLGDKR